MLISGSPDEDDPRVVAWPDFLEAGRAHAGARAWAVEQRMRSLAPEDLATIVYTSGTTGPPKGSMLTHANATWTLRSVDRAIALKEASERVRIGEVTPTAKIRRMVVRQRYAEEIEDLYR